MPEQSLTRVARARGAIIGALFGAAWLLGWNYQTSGITPSILFAIASGTILIVGAALTQSLRERRMDLKIQAGRRKNSMRLYGLINAGQWVLILAGAFTLGATGHPQWIAAFVILVVGLHFLPLALVFGDPLYYFTGASLTLLACLYPAISGPESPIGMLGAGIILWLTAVAAIAANSSFKPSREAARLDSDVSPQHSRPYRKRRKIVR